MEHTKFSRTKRTITQNISFELPINGKFYTVTATPYTVPAGDTLFRVSYNDGPVHIFGWDEGLERFSEMDTEAEVIPPVVEMAIADKLQDAISQLEDAA
ncbi:MAG: hypothetical protein ABIQ88_08590 [Chitinophagaceae bacterium]